MTPRSPVADELTTPRPSARDTGTRGRDARAARPVGRATAVVVGVLVALAALALGYLRVGSDRMEQACTTDAVWPVGAAGLETGWSWAPPGFRCAWDDGTVEQRLWW